jgi:predicted membrane-bound spermidine synthase
MRRYLLFTVFASGMTTLAAELSASRLLGNVFGTSNLVWASIIGLILIYLTLGYWLGGRWADKNPTPFAMYRVLAWGAFTLGVVPYIAGPVLRMAANAFDGFQFAVLGGAFAAVLVLFIVPITLLGTISPFAIRLSIEDAAHAGVTSGRIYAISTLGSFIGTFLPTLLLIPTIGTNRTFLVFSLFLLFVAIAGMAINGQKKQAILHLWMAAALAVIAALGTGQALKNSEGQVFETESAYNRMMTAANAPPKTANWNPSKAVAAARRTGCAVYGTMPSVNAPHARIRYMAKYVGVLSAQRPPRK